MTSKLRRTEVDAIHVSLTSSCVCREIFCFLSQSNLFCVGSLLVVATALASRSDMGVTLRRRRPRRCRQQCLPTALSPVFQG